MERAGAQRQRSFAAGRCALAATSGPRRMPLSRALALSRALLAALAFPLALACAGPSAATGADGAVGAPPQSVDALAAGIEHEPPSAAFETSKVLWQAGRKDDAVFFFYLGQLRFRVCLLPNP